MCKRRICRWHECRAEFEIPSPTYKHKLYCSEKCKRARKNWARVRGAALLEAALVFHETRHKPLIVDHNTGKKLTAAQVEHKYGSNHPTLRDGQFTNLAGLTRLIGEIREEIEG